jgi:hypothetical protein
VTKGLRPMLWILSSLAVLWIVIALIGFFSMGGMIGSMGRMHGGGMMSGGTAARSLMTASRSALTVPAGAIDFAPFNGALIGYKR